MEKKSPVLVGVLAVVAVVLLILSVYAFTSRYSKTETANMVNSAVSDSEAKLNAAHTSALNIVQAQVNDLAAKQAAAEAAQAASEAEKLKLAEEKAALAAQVAKYEADLAAEEVQAAAEECKYVLDKIYLNDPIADELLSDRELECKLFDGKVDFMDDSYDVEEVLALENLFVTANFADFGTQDFLQIPVESIVYTYKIDSDLVLADITEEDPLAITLMGSPIKIVDWDTVNDEITILEGVKYFVKEGDSITVGDKVVNIDVINDESVYVIVGTDSEIIDEGQSHKVGGLDIRVDSAMSSETKTLARLTIGPEVEQTLTTEDEYAKDSAWEWRISDHEISLVLIEDYTQPDDDDFKALAPAGKLCLPEDFLCVRYDGFKPELLDYKLSYQTDNTVKITGNFEVGLDSYTKLYIDNAGSIFWDLDEPKITEDIKLDGTDGLKLTTVPEIPAVPAYCSKQAWEGGGVTSEGQTDCLANDHHGDSLAHHTHIWHTLVPAIPAAGISIGNGLVSFNMHLTDVFVAGVGSIASHDENFLTNYGMVISDPENGVDDQKFSLKIPSELSEATISVMG